MEALILERTAHSPAVTLDPESGVARFEGNLVVPDAVSFFKPIMGWINSYFEKVGNPLHIEIRLDYFNTSASKMIQNMLVGVKKACDEGAEVKVDWHYQLTDEDMAEMAQEAAEISELDINFVVKTS